MTANMLVTLPWSPQRSNMFKVNSDESIIGKNFVATINGKSYSGTFPTNYTGVNIAFWRSTTDVGLDIYNISEDNTVTVDNIGACPSIETFQLKIDGVNVKIIPKS